MSNAEQQQQLQTLQLPIDWRIPDNMQSHYATNILIQPGQHEFFISFFEVRLPILLGQPEENKAKLEQTKSIPAECVARVIVAAEELPSFIEALQTTLNAYREAKSAQKD